jgi:hypothetical protein
MYITDVPTLTREGKLSHLCTLLRESYRQNGKVKNRTLANLTHCNPQEVDAMRLEIQPKTQKLDKMRCSPDMIFGPKTFGKGLFG